MILNFSYHSQLWISLITSLDHLVFENTIPNVSNRMSSNLLSYKLCFSFFEYLINSTIATSNIHFKIDYCNPLLLNLPTTEAMRLQLVLNSAARAVTNSPEFHHTTAILEILQWLKINQIIKYKVLTHTYKSLKLVNLLTFTFFFYSLHIVLLVLPLWPLVALLSLLVLKLQTYLNNILLMFCRIVSHLIYVSLLITSLLRLHLTHLSQIFQPLIFLKS